MTQLPIERLRAQIAADELETDAAQLAVAARLDMLARQLNNWRPRRSGLFSLFQRSSEPPPRGLYIYGDVGRGKTMLMDLFFACVGFAPKQRSHFHEFMADVHERIGQSPPGRSTAIRSRMSPPVSPKRRRYCASTRCRSPTLPTR